MISELRESKRNKSADFNIDEFMEILEQAQSQLAQKSEEIVILKLELSRL